jgi:hypothetical protein
MRSSQRTSGWWTCRPERPLKPKEERAKRIRERNRLNYLRLRQDPTFREKNRLKASAYYWKVRADPVLYAKRLAASRERNKGYKDKRRMTHLSAMTFPEKRKAYLEKRRQRYLQEKADPARYAKRLEKARAYDKKRHNREARERAANPELQAQYRQKAMEIYRKLMQDPAKRARRAELAREYRRKKKAQQAQAAHIPDAEMGGAKGPDAE